jgi:taurine--2-oxoglutarate transaminase
MEDEDVVGRSARLGEDVLGPGLRALAEKHDRIGEVRGTGAFWALELVSDRATREPLAPYGGSSPAVGAIVKACQERGMLPFVNYNRIHVVPPLTTTDDEAREGLAILDAALDATA